MNSRCLSLGLLFVLLGSLVLGCGKSAPKLHDVTGTVKLDGQNVPEGDIMFVSDYKSVGAEGGKIKDGKYTIKARDGKSRVEIRAVRLVPGKKGPMGEDAIEDYIPEKYNSKSDLEVEIRVGKTVHNFDLTK